MKKKDLNGWTMNKKSMIAAIAIVITFILWGCGQSEAVMERTTIAINEDGSVSLTIIESFEEFDESSEKTNYSQEELQTQILTETARYNKQKGESIKVDKVSIEKNNAIVSMTFNTVEDYAAFSEIDFFEGTVRTAYDEGFDLNHKLLNASNQEEIISKNELMEMPDYHIIITNDTEQMKVNGKILYHSKDVDVNQKNQTAVKKDDNEDIIMIVYK